MRSAWRIHRRALFLVGSLLVAIGGGLAGASAGLSLRTARFPLEGTELARGRVVGRPPRE